MKKKPSKKVQKKTREEVNTTYKKDVKPITVIDVFNALFMLLKTYKREPHKLVHLYLCVNRAVSCVYF